MGTIALSPLASIIQLSELLDEKSEESDGKKIRWPFNQPSDEVAFKLLKKNSLSFRIGPEREAS